MVKDNFVAKDIAELNLSDEVLALLNEKAIEELSEDDFITLAEDVLHN